MQVKQVEEMLKRWKASEQQLMTESLGTHIKFMEALCHRHQLWMNDAEGTEIARLHLEIIDTLQQAKQKYTQLLKIHEKTME